MREIVAAGGVVVRRQNGIPEFVVIHRPRYNDWSFPKGKVDPGETLEDAALREVFEETALRCELGASLGRRWYSAQNKVVHYWEMRVVHDDGFSPFDEVDEVRWVDAEHAASLLSHEQDRTLLSAYLGER